MFNIGSFFDKFNNVALQEIKKREIVIRILEKHTNTVFSIEEISFNNKIISIKASPGFKSQLYMKKEAILNDIRVALPGFIFTDVR